jgi:hypothetical protein
MSLPKPNTNAFENQPPVFGADYPGRPEPSRARRDAGSPPLYPFAELLELALTIATPIPHTKARRDEASSPPTIRSFYPELGEFAPQRPFFDKNNNIVYPDGAIARPLLKVSSEQSNIWFLVEN